MILTKKSLNNLIKEKYDFYIPDYQRGYKWTRTEVLKLLNDIWDFKLNHTIEDDSDFYCLQPVVVKPSEGRYVVIDGQQRLTTLLIIQQAVKDYDVRKNQYQVLEKYPDLAKDLMPVLKDTYSIEYQTRNRSSVWLANRNNEEEMQKNSDYFHIFQAYNATLDFLKWIDADTPDEYELDHQVCPPKKKKTTAASLFEACIKDKCHVIWYELDIENENDHEIFDRLNTGKIPLTNAELIKAMFLQEGNFPSLSDEVKIKSEDYRTNIARQWDDIEKKLQDPFFWDFIYDAKNVGMSYDTRIEYLFDLLANKERSDIDRYYYTFDYYDTLFQKYKEDGCDAIDFVRNEWNNVHELIQTLQDWYDNKTYYHYIGFLISQGHSVNKIKNIQFPKDKEGRNLPVPKKADFIKELEELVRKQISNYEAKHLMKSKKGLTPTLLLFNVLNVLDNSEMSDRFPFHYYKHTTWNEEHVAPNTPFDPNNKARCFQFAAQMLEYYTDISYFEVIEGLANANNKLPRNKRRKPEQLVTEAIVTVTPKFEEYIDQMEDPDTSKALLEIFKARGDKQEEQSKTVFNDIITSLGIKDLNVEDDRRDFIWNQVLLDEGTNKSYGNAIFPYKRMRVIKNTTRGVFVPVGTYNVFVKAYSHRMTNMLEWDENDAMRYLAEIFKTLNKNGRNFLNKELLEPNKLPEYVNHDMLLKLIRHEQ